MSDLSYHSRKVHDSAFPSEASSELEKDNTAHSQVISESSEEFDDPNIDDEYLIGFEDDSPYPEVRSAVANTDDFEMPASTLRAWVLGILWAVFLPGVNQFLFFRYPSVLISGIVVQLLSLPMGRGCAAFLPKWKILGVSLNPGPFSVKEHVIVTIMASVGGPSAYATDIIAVQRMYYNQSWSFLYQWMVVMSTQLIGFSIGGIAKRFLVSPPSMIWPANLVSCVLFNTLHSTRYSGIGSRGGISRERFFFYAFTAMFVWHFFPGYIFVALSYFSWVTWIKPDDARIAALFGYVHGMGMSVVSFDWSQIAYIGSPLATPWWAEANVFSGFVFFYWIITPILHFSNTWYGLYMPISSITSFDNTMQPYNVSRILTPDYNFDLEAYRNYSPLFLSTTFAVSYGLSFAAITATVVHTFLYFRKQIWKQSRRTLNEQPDIHARLMSRYQQVPEWWYLIIFLSMFAFGIIAITVWPTQMPVWAFILSLVIAFSYVVPIGMIQAITNQQIGLNVITELIIGYVLPGHPVAMMLFKTWGYITMLQALAFTSDFKLGHYMKIPPRAMFLCQVVATMISATTQLAVQSWMFTNIDGICTPNQKDGFICPSTEVFGTASIIWGVIGPALQFSSGQVYYALVFFFILGAIAPAVAYFWALRYPSSVMKYVNFPVIFNGTALIPPASALNYVPWAVVGFVFQYVIRRRHFSWWTKYNYVLSAALDSGVAVAVLIIFFCLQYPNNGTIGQNNINTWWGNSVFATGADGKGTPIRVLQDGETFGPKTW